MSRRVTADLNVTPLIDILLVLLIIFLSTVHMSQQGLDVNLPETQRSSPPGHSPQVMLELGADRRVTINTQPVEPDLLSARLRDTFENRHDRTLFVRGDGSLRYGEVVRVIDAARGAGVTRIGVVTEGALAGRR
jgi:biopolymer transport protein TolR